MNTVDTARQRLEQAVKAANGLSGEALIDWLEALTNEAELRGWVDELETVDSYIGIRKSELDDSYNGNNTYRERIYKTLQDRLAALLKQSKAKA